jgi:two-component system, OmpR family, sensor histidine kinase VicK
LFIYPFLSLIVMVGGRFENSIDESTEIIYGLKNVTARLLLDVYKTIEKIDFYLNRIGFSLLLTSEPLKNALIELEKNRKIKLRIITEITKDDIDYCQELNSIGCEVRYLEGIKGNFIINEKVYDIISIAQKSSQSTIQLLSCNIKSTVAQQQFLFDMLWSKSISAIAYQKKKEIDEGKETIQPIKTEVLQNQKDILKRLLEFYKDSDEISYCSPVDGIKLINNNFFELHNEILDKYRNGNHKGIRWITSINNDKDTELVKTFLEEGIMVRHVKDLSSAYFALSDKMLLFTIEKIEGQMVTNIIKSIDALYINHFYSVFENLWKKGIDIKDRIKDIEEGNYTNVEIIPNQAESGKLFIELFKNTKNEILMVLSSAAAFLRIENENGFKGIDELASNGIKIKILIPLKIELQDKINLFKKKYPNIEFRYLQNTLESLIGITIIDKERVLIIEIKDDTKKNYGDSIGLTIFIEGKSTALSYASIFENLWKQTEIYDEIMQAYEKIQRHDKMQKEFIDIAAHELRTPLQPIIGITTILKDEIQSKRHKELLDVVLRNTERLKKLSEEVLDVTKIESDSFNLNKENFKIKEKILQILDNYKDNSEIKNIKFEYNFSIDDDFIIYADKTRISQVISNLICNSLKFISKEKGEEGIISLSIEKRKNNGDVNNGMVIISIKDNGKGIDLEILPRLFTKFASKSFQGTGLGLYISKNIIEAHGGKIWAQNNKDGKGATFVFSLPWQSNKNRR